MATFAEIVKQSEQDRHRVYMLGIDVVRKNPRTGVERVVTKLVKAPRPLSKGEIAAREKAELEANRKSERIARAAKMAELYEMGGEEAMERNDVCINSLLPPAEFISPADSDMPIRLALILCGQTAE